MYLFIYKFLRSLQKLIKAMLIPAFNIHLSIGGILPSGNKKNMLVPYKLHARREIIDSLSWFLLQMIKFKHKLVLSRTINRGVERIKHILSTLSLSKLPNGATKEGMEVLQNHVRSDDDYCPNQWSECWKLRRFSSAFSGLFEVPSHIKLELVAFEKTTHKLGPNSVVYAIQHSLNMIKNLILCNLENSNVKTD